MREQTSVPITLLQKRARSLRRGAWLQKILVIFVLVGLMLVMPVQMRAVYGIPNTTIVELASMGKQKDAQQVVIEGEVVGDIVNTGNGFKWLTLLENGASISVLVAQEDADKISHLGRYDSQGTRVEVTGIFRVDCEEHDGLTDVHANKLTVLDEGHKIESVLDRGKIQIGMLLLLVGAALLFLHWRLRERTR